MRNLILAVLVSILLPTCSASQYPGKADHVTPKLRNPYLASVSLLNEDLRVFCSGSIIRNKEGEPLQILTAAHCVDSDPFIFISTAYDHDLRLTIVTKVDERVDLAILTSITDEKHDGPFVKVSRSEPKIGDEITVIGNPSGETGVVTHGTITKYQTMDHVLYYRMDAAAYFGNSGGMVVNKYGRIVGITDMLEFAILNVIVVDEEYGIAYRHPGAFAPSIKPGAFLAVSLPEIQKFLKK
jgi:S1-C subfamily serine protease